MTLSEGTLPWPDADILPPTERQLARIEELRTEMGHPEVTRPPQNQHEAYDWIGRLGAQVAEKRGTVWA